MPQLLIHDESGDTRSLEVNSETITVGRRRGNSLRLPHLSVSGYHARIFDENGCLIIEDLGSTNGTMVNGKKIMKQVLVHLDDIIIGSYRISYSETYSSETLKLITAGSSQRSANAPIVNSTLTAPSQNVAVIKVASGHKAGNVVMLEKPVTTLGKSGGDMGAISKKSTGYYFVPFNESTKAMRHNGRGLTPQVEIKLLGGDMIEMGGEYLEFIHPYRA